MQERLMGPFVALLPQYDVEIFPDPDTFINPWHTFPRCATMARKDAQHQFRLRLGPARVFYLLVTAAIAYPKRSCRRE